jgi:hypothetical protein
MKAITVTLISLLFSFPLMAKPQAWETCTNTWGDVVSVRADGSCPSDNTPLWYVYLNSPYSIADIVTKSNERIAITNARAASSGPGVVVSNGSSSSSQSSSNAVNSNNIRNNVQNNNANVNSNVNSNNNTNVNANLGFQ